MKTQNIFILMTMLMLVGVHESAASGLKQNYPNPFTTQTSIRFVLDDAQNVCLSIYNLRGGKVRTLCHGVAFSADSHDVVWDGNDEAGRRVPDGVYFIRLETGSLKETNKMVLTR